MQSILIEKLRAFILENNPDLVVQLQADYSVSKYLEDKVSTVASLMDQLLAENKPAYIIEELCLNEITAGLKPSKFNYIKSVLEEDFPKEYAALSDSGVLTYETINLVEDCKEHFESFGFSEKNEDNRLLRYAVIAAIATFFN